ncbi:MAG: ribosome small subunit-dependent GTPase A [Verrucomicrobiota bacterium]
MTLEDLGWNAAFAKQWEACGGTAKGWVPARLIRDNKITYGALTGEGEELEVVMSGKVYHEAQTDAELPAVGDWVALEVGDDDHEHVIRARLDRQNSLSRKMSGRSTEEQVIAANIDVAVVVTDAGSDFNLRRMERYFAIIGRSRAKAVVLVNKADLYSAAQNQAAVEAIAALNPEADVHLTSVVKKTTLKGLKSYLQRGVSVTFAGSSGVGKSSVINYLLGDEYQWTDEVNAATGKGRHTTTARELMVLRSGGIIIDNPGIREVHMWTDEATLRERFADLDALARQCKFTDCRHGAANAGCAIQAAITAGKLDARRLEGLLKLDEEIALLQRNRQKRQMTVERRTRREHQSQSRKYAERNAGHREHDY